MMYLFKSNRYKECFNNLPSLVKSRTIKKVEQLKNSFLASTVMLKPLKNYEDTYSWSIDKDYFIALLLAGRIWMLLFVGKNGEDIAG